MAAAIRVAIQAEDFDPARETAEMTAGRSDIGAVVSFVGLCRSEGGNLAALEIEHFLGMAEAEIRHIAEDACRRWPLQALTVIHRHGRIVPGEQIVLVLAASTHRGQAFAAAGFVMDYLKTDAPFWKKEWRRDGSARWVNAAPRDDEARRRWNLPEHEKTRRGSGGGS